MLAAEVVDAEGTFRIGDIPKPSAGANEVVIRVVAAGLAPGAFNLLRMGRVPIVPTVLGHEIAGIVESVGEGVDPTLADQRVRVHPLLSCGVCDYCTTDREMMCSANSMIGHAIFGPDAMPRYSKYHNGGLAEYVVVPAANVDLLPESLSFDLGAKTHDFANAVRAFKLAETEAGSTIAVTAATGAMGVATIAIARWYGVRRIIAVGRDEDRLAAVQAIDPELVRTVTISPDDDARGVTGRMRAIEPAGVDAVIDYFPHGKGTSFVFGGIKTGGRLVHMGVNPEPLVIPPAAFSVNCITFVGTRNGTRKDAHDAMRLLAEDPKRYEDLITHRFTLDDVDRARDIFRDRQEPMWMAVVSPTSRTHPATAG
ncbi:alcohol dehydrogenase catalytic domain-containing protein [Kribbella qitaiheensis]|uniref:Alcohol dehydrogenase catalytic domain-containing protein n=1 Tax=Kribbella qitaiheensis TaxID=1544730 RepID=A0A7G6X541_9ACTN|nr:alcohol dehydrogenase catalytic domain-containing protein [Kribbella qitaiheensis]QNE21356.1 alcohol dehydrogenase catalytic domain-containing protein [Kribbella qitaiheensis]